MNNWFDVQKLKISQVTTSCWKELCRVINFRFETDAINNMHLTLNHEEEFQKQLRLYLDDAKARIIFIVGEWGAGKTVQIEQFIKKEEGKRKISKVTFFGGQTIDQALMSTVNFWWRLGFALFISSFCAILYRYYENHWESTFVETFFAVFAFLVGCFVILNRGRVAYLLSQVLNSYSKKILVFEDLDRSSIPITEIWGMLSNLWFYNRQYIVTYVYSTDEEKVAVFEAIEKLNAAKIELQLEGKAIASIVSKLYPIFPFDGGDWLALFPPRKAIKIIENIMISIPETASDNRKQAEIFKAFFWALIKVFYPERDGNPFDVVQLKADGGRFRLSPGSGNTYISEKQKIVFESFGPSTNNIFLSKVFSVCTSNASNRIEVALRQLVSDDPKEKNELIEKL